MELFSINIAGWGLHLDNEGLHVGKRSQLTNTSQYFKDFLGLENSESGESVNESTAVNLSTVQACVKILAETKAQVPLNYYQKTDRGKELLEEDSLYYLMEFEPNPSMSAFTFRETMAYYEHLMGNAYAFIVRDGNGVATELWPVQPERVKVLLSNDKTKVFYELDGNKDNRIPERYMLHIKGISKNGFEGLSPINISRELFGEGLAMQKHTNRFFKNGASPGTIYHTPNALNQQQVDQIKDQINKYTGSGQGKSMVLPGVDKVSSGMIPQKDAQFIESRKFTKEQIAEIYRIPLPLLNDLSNANYSNVEALSLNFAQYTMIPQFKRWEQELHRKLVPRTQLLTRYFKFDFKELLRSDSLTRAQRYETLKRIGAISPNEIREGEDMDKLDMPGMDKTWKQMQDVPIDEPIQNSNRLNGKTKQNGHYEYAN